MKGKLGSVIVISVLAMVVFAVDAAAFDAEVYTGAYFDSTLRACPDGGEAAYLVGMEVGHRMGPVRLYVSSERICDEYVKGSNGGFHPSSARWKVGGEIDIKYGLSVGVEHMCWHPVDNGGTVEQYNMVKAVWRFGEE